MVFDVSDLLNPFSGDRSLCMFEFELLDARNLIIPIC
jgi:hypothetical protein